MTPKQEAALWLALEALDSYHGYMEPLTTVFGGPRVPAEQSTTGKVEKAITALRRALEQQPNRALVTCLFDAAAKSGNPKSIELAAQLSGVPPCEKCGYVIQHCRCPQPAEEPVAWINWCAATGKRSVSFECESELASQPLYEGITQNTQYHYSKFHSWFDSELHRKKYTQDHPAYLAAQEAWNAANDAAQHRINRLNAEIEAWKVRFKIAEDALAKLNGPEQKPVAYGLFVNGELSWDSEWAFSNESFPVQFDDEECRPLYTSPPASKPWVGLTDEEVDECYYWKGRQWTTDELVRHVEAKLREKNAPQQSKEDA